MDPSQVKTWIDKGLDVISCDPGPFLTVVAAVAMIIWTVVWLIFRGQIHGKDSALEASLGEIRAKDATIEALRTRLEDTGMSRVQVLEEERQLVEKQDGDLAARMLDLRVTYSEIETELLSIRKDVALALDTESWWPMGLPAFAWQKHQRLLAEGESAEEQEVFRACQTVYVLANAANKLVHLYHASPPTEKHLRTITELQDATNKALALLGERLWT